jgi:hypothetical protein
MIRNIFLLGFIFSSISLTAAYPSGIFGDKFQGDIQLNEDQKELLTRDPESLAPSTGWTHTSFRWPTNLQGFVTVPYRINPSEGFCKLKLYTYSIIQNIHFKIICKQLKVKST